MSYSRWSLVQVDTSGALIRLPCPLCLQEIRSPHLRVARARIPGQWAKPSPPLAQCSALLPAGFLGCLPCLPSCRGQWRWGLVRGGSPRLLPGTWHSYSPAPWPGATSVCRAPGPGRGSSHPVTTLPWSALSEAHSRGGEPVTPIIKQDSQRKVMVYKTRF